MITSRSWTPLRSKASGWRGWECTLNALDGGDVDSKVLTELWQIGCCAENVGASFERQTRLVGESEGEDAN